MFGVPHPSDTIITSLIFTGWTINIIVMLMPNEDYGQCLADSLQHVLVFAFSKVHTSSCACKYFWFQGFTSAHQFVLGIMITLVLLGLNSVLHDGREGGGVATGECTRLVHWGGRISRHVQSSWTSSLWGDQHFQIGHSWIFWIILDLPQKCIQREYLSFISAVRHSLIDWKWKLHLQELR